jgi:hypothetical protein
MKRLNNKDLHDQLLDLVCSDTKKIEFTAWGGEQILTVHISAGAHGFYSAAMVIEHVDSPIEVKTYEGYKRGLANSVMGWEKCYHWLIDSLHEVITPGEGNPDQSRGQLNLITEERYDQHTNGMVKATYGQISWG